jgi:hypothetical protein
VKMIDRHRDRIIDTLKRTSERRISAPSKLISRDCSRRSSPSRQDYCITRPAELRFLHRHRWRT